MAEIEQGAVLAHFRGGPLDGTARWIEMDGYAGRRHVPREQVLQPAPEPQRWDEPVTDAAVALPAPLVYRLTGPATPDGAIYELVGP